ncbi:MAG: type IV secretion system DNA-binding domain-containing protein [Holosporaceae bacterium]|nr:type IV secretion system DNA-binding domain-containing protein [Holosporaceae bacterium]
MCFSYVKAKFRSLFFFLPDNWLSGIDVKARVGNFRRIIATWDDVFTEEGWKLYLYIFNTFAVSFLICGSAVYKYYQRQNKKFRDGITITGKLLKLDEFKEKYPEVFGNHLTFAGLNLSEQIFKTPFYIWGNDEAINKTLGELLEDMRKERKKVIVLEGSKVLFNKFAKKEDILLNPLEENGVSWDFFSDMKAHEILIQELLKKIKAKDRYLEMEDLIKYLLNMNSSTKQFFQILCFNPFKDIRATLKPFTNIEDNADTLIAMRNQMANDLYYFKCLISNTKEISLHEYYKSENSILWISNADNEKMRNLISFIEKIIDPSILKISIGEKIIKNVENTIVINHSLENSRKLLRDNKLLLSQTQNTKRLIDLFGDTITEYPTFFKKRYKNEIKSIISENDIISGNSFFKYKNKDDVLRF